MDMDSRNHVNEALGLNVIYTTIRDWDACTATHTQPLTGHNVAHFIHSRYGDQFAYNCPALWRAVEIVADEEIWEAGHAPESLTAALAGFDDNLR